MKRTSVAILAAAVVGVFAAEPGSAQEWRFDLGIYGGGSWYSSSLDDDQLGQDAEDVKFEPGWQLGTQLGWWLHPRFGLRANGGYSERPLDQGGEVVAGDINLWDVTGDLMIRLRPVPEEWFGTETLPYLALGAGVKEINPATNIPIENGEVDGIMFFPEGSQAAGQTFFMDHKTKFQALVGLGADFRFRPNMALRLEVGDRIWDTPIHFLQGDQRFPPGDENIGNWVHQVYGNLGLQFLFGLAEVVEEVVAPPPPPPAPAPPPPPPPEERNITVCVVDPTTGEFGIRTVSAVYVPSTGDTLVVVNGQRRPLSGTVGTIMLAPQADWYIAGSPMTLTVGRTEAEFVTVGGARQISANDLAYLGNVNGLPVYASRNDVTDLREELADLREARNTNDLEEIFEEEEDVREEFDELDIVYVPLRATDCVFQGLQRVEEVRKAGEDDLR
ncbi:MAG: outer membrane beta-barrel protein [Longimicrobiales bacterium]